MYEPWPTQEYPPAWRVVLGFIIAPASAALLMAAWMPGYDGLPPLQAFWNSAWLYAVIGAYPPTILLGVPAYFALRRHVRATLRNCMLVGAALPFFTWGLFSVLPPSAEWESVGGKAIVIDGHRTLYGWELVGRDLIVLAAFGAAAGLVFGFIVVGWRRRSASPEICS
jgi:hypothetical protein